MKKLSLLAAALAVSASAQASPILFSFDNALGPMEISQTGTLGLFDTTLGTLTGAVFTIYGAIEGDITLNYGAATNPANLRGTTTSEFGFNSSLAVIDALFNGVSDVSLSYTTGFVAMNPSTSFVSDTLTDTEALGPFALGPLAALQAAGGGTFEVTCDSLSGFSVTGGGGFAGGTQNTFGRCGASIEYTFTPPTQVPEPSALALVGLALAGLGLSRRRAAK